MSSSQKKHANLPIFVPHMGCPHGCVFCNQRTISGTNAFSLSKAEETLKNALKTLGERQAELAFFGGSFTAIDRELMIALLVMGKREIESGRICGIRLSTRPDCIDEKILDLLERYGVSAIELGLQSTDGQVLDACQRRHTPSDGQRALRLIKDRGCFEAGGQMMLGLPLSTPEKEKKTALDICAWGADTVRIYPTVVLEGTELGALYKSGRYVPLTLEEGVKRTAELIPLFEERGVKILRMGLQAEEGLKDALAGCYHPAFGELAENALWRTLLEELFEHHPPKRGKAYTVSLPRGHLSKAIGQKGANKKYLSEKYGCRLRFKESDLLTGRTATVEEGAYSATEIT